MTDIVFVDTLHLSATVGPDWWGRTRPQPVTVSAYLHLRNSFLTTAGQSDDVFDSVNYSNLSKAITNRITRQSFNGAEKLVDVIAEEAFNVAGEVAEEVRVVVHLPKQILLAESFSIDVTVPFNASHKSSRKVSVMNLILPVLIGVNPPERETKQHVINNITFRDTNDKPLINYLTIIAEIVKNIENSAHLTLEKFVLEIIRTAYAASEDVDLITVRSQKPSALSFAHSSGVEITRQRAQMVSQ